MALTKKNVRVMIGAEECRVTSMSQTQLTCQPDPPKVLNMESSPTVRVSGRRRSLELSQCTDDLDNNHKIIIAAEMAVFNVAVNLVEGSRRWPVYNLLLPHEDNIPNKFRI